METVKEPGTMSATERKKGRSQAEKVGRRKYMIKMLHRLEAKLDRIDKRTRVIMACLSHYMDPSQDYLNGCLQG